MMLTTLTTITILERENYYIISRKADFSWRNPEVQKDLEQIGIMYSGSHHAVKVRKTDMGNVYFTLGMEKDGELLFEKSRGEFLYEFDMCYSDDLVSMLNAAIAYAKE